MRRFIDVTLEVPSSFGTNVLSLLMPRHTLRPNTEGVRDENQLYSYRKEEILRDQLKVKSVCVGVYTWNDYRAGAYW